MEMQQIRYFLALSQSLNFTRAAEECHVSQPALTRAIQALEAELGGELVRRERAQSHLTELGRRMLPFMQQCYDAAASARSLAQAVKSNAAASLPLGISHSVSMSAFVPPFVELFRAYPGLQLKIRRGTAEEILGMLKSGDIELVIAGPLGAGWDRLDSWTVLREKMSLVAHRDHRLARSNEIGPSQLAGEHMLVRTGCEMARTVLEHLGTHGITAKVSHEIATDDELLALLEANAGIAVLPESGPHPASLVQLPFPEWDVQREVSIYAAAGRRRSDVANNLLNLLRSADFGT